MFGKVKISLGNNSGDKMVVYKNIEKFKRNIIVEVDSSHRAVIFKDNNVSQVLDAGIYKPFTKQDKKSALSVVFVNISKSKEIFFTTRIANIKDNFTKTIYDCYFTGSYVIGVRNERKFLGTSNLSNTDFSLEDFAFSVENEVNGQILSYISQYFLINKISVKDFEKEQQNIAKHILVELDKYLDNTYGLEVRTVNFDKIHIQNEMLFN